MRAASGRPKICVRRARTSRRRTSHNHRLFEPRSPSAFRAGFPSFTSALRRTGTFIARSGHRHCHWRSYIMRIVRISRGSLTTGIALLALTLPSHGAQLKGQTTATTISSSAGAVEWDHGPVVAGQVTNLGVQDVCPPGLCDNHDLNVVLPSPAATFYTNNTATLTIKFTWTSSAPTDIDLFGVSPAGADHGPGAPDGLFTGPGYETLTITDPIDGLWHIRSTAALSPIPTSVHAVATLTAAAKPTSAAAPPQPHGVATFVNYAAPEDCPPGPVPGT